MPLRPVTFLLAFACLALMLFASAPSANASPTSLIPASATLTAADCLNGQCPNGQCPVQVQALPQVIISVPAPAPAPAPARVISDIPIGNFVTEHVIKERYSVRGVGFRRMRSFGRIALAPARVSVGIVAMPFRLLGGGCCN